MNPLLLVDDVVVDINLRRDRRRAGPDVLRAVDHVSFTLAEGTTIGLVGESGSGKSTLASAIVGTRQPTNGSVYFGGVDVATLDRAARKRFRRDVQVIFQDPSSALNPRMALHDIVAEPMLVHGLVGDRSARRTRAIELLGRCGIGPSMAELHPHALSGGQKQRVAVARALAAEPRLILADEPTSALDVSVQSQLLALLRNVQVETGVAMLFISHDLGVVRQVAHEVAVMSRGQLVERGVTAEVFASPHDDYTRVLLESYVLDERARPEPPGDVATDAVEADVDLDAGDSVGTLSPIGALRPVING